MIDVARVSAPIVAGMKRLTVDDQHTLEHVELFDPGVAVGRIVRARGEPEALLDARGQRDRAGEGEPARQLRRRQPPGQLQQRQRVATGVDPRDRFLSVAAFLAQFDSLDSETC